ncbi:hypothetical protein, partial [Thermoleptolyngbya sp. M55_K2018_002]|uniref:hypothetical protein n=1 Tax=Thermoleptolyngbya sp. M55_K2018_002 TaxID=2747808 RepID=UPI0025E18815
EPCAARRAGGAGALGFIFWVLYLSMSTYLVLDLAPARRYRGDRPTMAEQLQKCLLWIETQ